MRTLTLALSFITIILFIEGCGKNTEPSATDNSPKTYGSSAVVETSGIGSDGEKRALFGDVHVHTMYSFDAFVFGTKASPDQAYEFAKGEPLRHAGGYIMQLQRPLDFYAISDHALFLGSIRALTIPSEPLSKHPLAEGMDKLREGNNRRKKFIQLRDFAGSDNRHELANDKVAKSAWDDIVSAAKRHNDPGKFTTLIAYEYTASSEDAGNLHRNVIFRTNKAPEKLFSRIDSNNPEDLWDWMDELRNKGIDSLSIPHNSNGSNGNMFALRTFDGELLNKAYSDQRLRNEPLIELVQIKGSSETHPALNPNDEWANFEIMHYRIGTILFSQPSGSYVREAIGRGLELERQRGFNPFEFGFIGSSDTHNASYAGAEYDYWGKIGEVDGTPRLRSSVPLKQPNDDSTLYAPVYYDNWSAAGLAGVWAKANTREAIFDAMRRRETFATSGPRIKVKLTAKVGNDADIVLMGEAIEAPSQSPTFSLSALRDALSAPLQRLQIVKVWASETGPQEAIYDVACSGGATPIATTNRCPDNGASVDLADCSFDKNAGAPMLKADWSDPNYDDDQQAAYYARVLENPTCRWSTWDAIRAGVSPRSDLATTLQERAWTSPIWLKP